MNTIIKTLVTFTALTITGLANEHATFIPTTPSLTTITSDRIITLLPVSGNQSGAFQRLEMLERKVKQVSCSDYNIARAIKNGIKIEYIYVDMKANQAAVIVIDDCKGLE